MRAVRGLLVCSYLMHVCAHYTPMEGLTKKINGHKTCGELLTSIH